MSRGTNAEVDNADHVGPAYNPYFYFEENDKEHGVWFLDAITFLNELREAREQKAGGIAINGFNASAWWAGGEQNGSGHKAGSSSDSGKRIR